jgi:hypothetical protein
MVLILHARLYLYGAGLPKQQSTCRSSRAHYLDSELTSGPLTSEYCSREEVKAML